MTQYDLPTIDGTPITGTSGTTLATYLNSWKSAVLSNQAGAARPAGAVASQIWVKVVSSTAHEIYYFDGTDDILIGTVDPTNNRFSINTAYNIFSNANNNAIGPTLTPVDGMSWDRANAVMVLSKSAGPVLQLARHGSNGVTQEFFRNNMSVGSISVTTTATAFNTSSDYRLKYDVETIVSFNVDAVTEALSGPLGKLMKVRPVKYKMYSDDTNATLYGFIAHELQEQVPHAVTGFKDEEREDMVKVGEVEDAANPGQMLPVMDMVRTPVMQGVDHSQVMSLAIAAIQQLTLRVLELEARQKQE